MSTHLPLRLCRPLQRQCVSYPLSTRFFSSTPTLARRSDGTPRKRGQVDPVVASAAARYQEGKSSTALQEEQLRDERNVPDDIGLVPGTFVHAPLFPLTQFSLGERLRYEWKWATSRGTAWFQLFRFKRNFKTSKPKVYWLTDRKQLCNKALEKYKHLYESFARADSKAISNVCLPNVAEKFQKRIDSRPRELRMRWDIGNRPSCTIVSNIASPLSIPGYDETGVHQVVFRIRSNQMLKLDWQQSSRKDTRPESTPKNPKVEEFLVLQRRFIRGSAQEWKIWGFTDISTPDTIAKAEQHARDINAYQAA